MMRSGFGLLISVALGAAVASCGSSESSEAPVTRPAATSTVTSPAEQSTLDTSSKASLSLVVVGDSIPYNSSEDCPGCTGFVERYAEVLEEATGREVTTTNLSQHNGLTLPMLMDELDEFEDDLRNADAIIVGIAHNSIALNDDHACGSNWIEASNTFDDWSKLTPACATEAADSFRPLYEELFSTVSEWRAGHPTVLRAINRYNDWIGWEDAALTDEQTASTVVFLDTWNAMLCDAAASNDFDCVDIYHAFNGPDGTTASGDLLAADYTHPSDVGNELIARQLVESGFAPLA